MATLFVDFKVLNEKNFAEAFRKAEKKVEQAEKALERFKEQGQQSTLKFHQLEKQLGELIGVVARSSMAMAQHKKANQDMNAEVYTATEKKKKYMQVVKELARETGKSEEAIHAELRALKMAKKVTTEALEAEKRLAAEKKKNRLEKEKGIKSSKNDIKWIMKTAEQQTLLSERMSATNKIMRQMNLTAKQTRLAFKETFGSDYNRQQLKKINDRIEKTTREFKKTGREGENAFKAISRGAGNATRSMGILNSGFGKLSIVMSGIAASLFVWQEFLQVMRLLTAEGAKVESTMAGLRSKLVLNNTEFKELEIYMRDLSKAGKGDFKDMSEAMVLLAKHTNSFKRSQELLPTVMAMTKNGQIEVKDAVWEAVHGTYNLKDSLIEVEEIIQGTLTRSAQNFKAEWKDLTVDAYEAMKSDLSRLLDLVSDALAGIKNARDEFNDISAEDIERLSQADKPAENFKKALGKIKIGGAYVFDPVTVKIEVHPDKTLKELLGGRAEDWLSILEGDDRGGDPENIVPAAPKEDASFYKAQLEEKKKLWESSYRLLGTLTKEYEAELTAEIKQNYLDREAAMRSFNDGEYSKEDKHLNNLMKRREEFNLKTKKHQQQIRADQKKFTETGIMTGFLKGYELEKINIYTRSLRGVNEELRVQINRRMKLQLNLKETEAGFKREQKLFQQSGVLTGSYLTANEKYIEALMLKLQEFQGELGLTNVQLENIKLGLEEKTAALQFKQLIPYYQAFYKATGKMSAKHYALKEDQLKRYQGVVYRQLAGDQKDEEQIQRAKEMAEAIHYKNLINLREEYIRGTEDMGSGIKIAFEQMAQDLETWGEFGIKIFDNVWDSMEDGFTSATASMLQGNLDAWEDYANVIKSLFAGVVAEMATLALKNKVVVPIIYEALGNMGGGASAIGSGWAAQAWSGTIPHTSWMPGASKPGSLRPSNDPADNVGGALGYGYEEVDEGITGGQAISYLAGIRGGIEAIQSVQEERWGEATFKVLKSGAWIAAAYTKHPYALAAAVGLEIADAVGLDSFFEDIKNTLFPEDTHSSLFRPTSQKYGELPSYRSSTREGGWLSDEEASITNAMALLTASTYGVINEWLISLPDEVADGVEYHLENTTFKTLGGYVNWDTGSGIDPGQLTQQLSVEYYKEAMRAVLNDLEKHDAFDTLDRASVLNQLPSIFKDQLNRATSYEDLETLFKNLSGYTKELNAISDFVSAVNLLAEGAEQDIPRAVTEYRELTAEFKALSDAAEEMQLGEGFIAFIEETEAASKAKWLADLTKDIKDFSDGILGVESRIIDDINETYDAYILTLDKTEQGIYAVAAAERERMELIKAYQARLLDDVEQLYLSVVTPTNAVSALADQFTALIDVMKQEESSVEDLAKAYSLMSAGLIAKLGQSNIDPTASSNPFSALFSTIEKYIKGRERTDWTLTEWSEEFGSLLEQYNELDQTSATYFDDALVLLTDQFDALKSIDAKMDEQISELEGLQESIENSISDLTFGDDAPSVSQGGLQAEYDRLGLLATNSGGVGLADPADIEAFIDFAMQTFLPYMQTLTAEGDNYQVIVDRVKNDLTSLNYNIENELDVLRQIRDNMSTENTLWLLYSAMIGWQALMSTGISTFQNMGTFLGSATGSATATAGGFSTPEDLSAAITEGYSTSASAGLSQTAIGDTGYLYTAAHAYEPDAIQTAFSTLPGLTMEEIGLTGSHTQPFSTSQGVEGLVENAPQFVKERELYGGIGYNSMTDAQTVSLLRANLNTLAGMIGGYGLQANEDGVVYRVYGDPYGTGNELTVVKTDNFQTESLNPYRPAGLEHVDWYLIMRDLYESGSLPTFARGGLASSPSIFGENGPEWAVPMHNSSYNEGFMKSVGIDQILSNTMTSEDAQRMIELLAVIASNGDKPIVVNNNVDSNAVALATSINNVVEQSPNYYPAIANRGK